MAEITIKLTFQGGPLCGSVKHQQIPSDWQMIRYEHRPSTDASIAHVYSGQRKPEQTAVQLQYVGAVSRDSAMIEKDKPLRLEFIGSLSDSALDALADLLLNGTVPDCELCGQQPQEHYIESGQWAGRHVCTSCWQSLLDQPEGC